jgi:hypothetical protein
MLDKNRILIALSESDRTKILTEPFRRQTLPQQVFSAIWLLEAEVNNGGFSQYFGNFHSSESAEFVVEALTAIVAPLTADICGRAISVAFPSGLPVDSAAIRSAAANFSPKVLDALNSLDQEFFAYPHNLTDLLFAYVTKHSEEFGVMPTEEAT